MVVDSKLTDKQCYQLFLISSKLQTLSSVSPCDSQKLTGTRRDSQELAGTHRNSYGYTETHMDTHELTETHRDSN